MRGRADRRENPVALQPRKLTRANTRGTWMEMSGDFPAGNIALVWLTLASIQHVGICVNDRKPPSQVKQ